MRTQEGCGLGSYVSLERTTIRARASNKQSQTLLETLFLQYLFKVTPLGASSPALTLHRGLATF